MKSIAQKTFRGSCAIAIILSASIFLAAKVPDSLKTCSDTPAVRLISASNLDSEADESSPMTSLEIRIEESRKTLAKFRTRIDDETRDASSLKTDAIEPIKPEFKFDYAYSDFDRRSESTGKFHFEPLRTPDATDPFKIAPLGSMDPPDDPDDLKADRGFQWRPAIYQSFMMIAIQHGYALGFQEKTRRALKGPFFRDYWDSVKALDGWDDGNRFFTNYIAHPMQGALTGFIYLQNQPRTKNQRFGLSKEYWHDRLIAFAWSTAWSTQWELGPISQSSIGNVGLYGGMGYVDLVITPTVGTAWLVTEEALDRYVISKWERRGWTAKVLARMFLNPMRTIANLLRFQVPWYRDRPVGFSRIPVGQLGG